MRVGKEYGVNSTDLVLQRLVPEVGACVDEDNSAIIEGKAGRGSVPMIAGVCRGAYLTGTPWEGNSC